MSEEANRCRYCNKQILGLIACDCEKSKKSIYLWNKDVRDKISGKRRKR